MALAWLWSTPGPAHPSESNLPKQSVACSFPTLVFGLCSKLCFNCFKHLVSVNFFSPSLYGQCRSKKRALNTWLFNVSLNKGVLFGGAHCCHDFWAGSAVQGMTRWLIQEESVLETADLPHKPLAALCYGQPAPGLAVRDGQKTSAKIIFNWEQYFLDTAESHPPPPPERFSWKHRDFSERSRRKNIGVRRRISEKKNKPHFWIIF